MSKRINGDFVRDALDLPRCYSCAYWDQKPTTTPDGGMASCAGHGHCHRPAGDRGRIEIVRPNGAEIAGSMYCPSLLKHFLHFCPLHRWAGDPEQESLV